VALGDVFERQGEVEHLPRFDGAARDELDVLREEPSNVEVWGCAASEILVDFEFDPTPGTPPSLLS
jgi:hypothetical protein